MATVTVMTTKLSIHLAWLSVWIVTDNFIDCILKEKLFNKQFLMLFPNEIATQISHYNLETGIILRSAIYLHTIPYPFDVFLWTGNCNNIFISLFFPQTTMFFHYHRSVYKNLGNEKGLWLSLEIRRMFGLFILKYTQCIHSPFVLAAGHSVL